MEFLDWKPRDLANASMMNRGIRDPHCYLSNSTRFIASGVSKIGKVEDTGAYKTLKWDAVEEYGGWASTNNESFTVPASGVYFISADFTAVSPKDETRRPAIRLAVIAQTDKDERELFRSYNSTLNPSVFITSSVRDCAYIDRGTRIISRVNTPAGTGAWDIATGSRTSTQLNRLSAILIAPGATQ